MFKGLFFTLKREDHHSLTVERDDWLGKQHGLKIKPHSEHRDEGLGPCIPPGEAHTCILPWEGKNDNSNNNKNTFTLLPHVNRPFQQQGQRQKLSWWSPKYARPWISICHRPSAWITTTSYFFTVASNSWLSRLLACLPHVLCGPGCLSIMLTITAEGPLPGSWHICPQCEWNDIFFLQERWLYKPLILLTILKALILRISVTSWVLRTLFFCALQLSLPPSALCGDEKSLSKCYFHPSPLVSKVLSQTDLLSLLQLFLATQYMQFLHHSSHAVLPVLKHLMPSLLVLILSIMGTIFSSSTYPFIKLLIKCHLTLSVTLLVTTVLIH